MPPSLEKIFQIYGVQIPGKCNYEWKFLLMHPPQAKLPNKFSSSPLPKQRQITYSPQSKFLWKAFFPQQKGGGRKVCSALNKKNPSTTNNTFEQTEAQQTMSLKREKSYWKLLITLLMLKISNVRTWNKGQQEIFFKINVTKTL